MIELGSGCGLVGLVLAALGAQVALTDLPKTMVNPGSLHLLRKSDICTVLSKETLSRQQASCKPSLYKQQTFYTSIISLQVESSLHYWVPHKVKSGKDILLHTGPAKTQYCLECDNAGTQWWLSGGLPTDMG